LDGRAVRGPRGAASHERRIDHGEENEAVYSTPWDAPLASAFPIRCEGVEFLTACYRTDPDAIRRLLPQPLDAISDVVLVHVYTMASADFTGRAVSEASVTVGVRLEVDGEELVGGYTPYFVVESDAALATGREVYGQPKKVGEVSLAVRGDLIVGEARRNGIRVITTTLPYRQHRVEPDAIRQHFDFTENFNFKLIPNPDGTPAVRQLTARRLADLHVHGCWAGPSTVELRPNAQLPVWRLPVVEPLEGYSWSADFTLVPGRTVVDYLRPASA
jgi:acetoacetate decarboxylase